MSRMKPAAALMVARVYPRVSTGAQDLERQQGVIAAAKAAGYCVAGTHRHPPGPAALGVATGPEALMRGAPNVAAR